MKLINRVEMDFMDDSSKPSTVRLKRGDIEEYIDFVFKFHFLLIEEDQFSSMLPSIYSSISLLRRGTAPAQITSWFCIRCIMCTLAHKLNSERHRFELILTWACKCDARNGTLLHEFHKKHQNNTGRLQKQKKKK